VPAWRAIVFDLDDTLYPERDFVLSGFRAVASWAQTEFSVRQELISRELVALFAEGVRGDTFDRSFRSLRLPVERIPDAVRVYREHVPAIRPYPEVPPMLEQLRRGYTLGLVSDGHLHVQRRKLAALGVGHLFDAIVFSDALGRESWKPSTRPFEEVLAALRVRASEAVYVADNPLKDFLGARQVGMATIWCRHSRGDYAVLSAPSAEHSSDHITETIASILELCQRGG
jgi:putative hydrolase of the HAD superfamily